MGTLMKKTLCQETCSTNRPPTIGPAAVAMAVAETQIPMARFSLVLQGMQCAEGPTS